MRMNPLTRRAAFLLVGLIRRLPLRDRVRPPPAGHMGSALARTNCRRRRPARSSWSVRPGLTGYAWAYTGRTSSRILDNSPSRRTMPSSPVRHSAQCAGHPGVLHHVEHERTAGSARESDTLLAAGPYRVGLLR